MEVWVKRVRVWERNDDVLGCLFGLYVISIMYFIWVSKVKNFLCEMKWEILLIVRFVFGKKIKIKKEK